MKESEQKAAAKKFAETWKEHGHEKGETYRISIAIEEKQRKQRRFHDSIGAFRRKAKQKKCEFWEIP